MNYYTQIDGDSAGPFTVNELTRRGLDRETPIFDEETNGYVPAVRVPELARLIRRLERRRSRGATTRCPSGGGVRT